MAPSGNDLLRGTGYAAAGVGTVAVITVALPALGFGAGGISAGSAAAKGMSIAATSGYGMAIISACQSAGAAGLAVTTKLALGGATSLTAWYYGSRK